MLTNRLAFLKKHGLPKDTSLSLSEIAKLSGFPTQALQEVYNRGVGAWKTNNVSVRLRPGTPYGRAYQKNVAAPPSSKLTPEQWGYGRVFAFVMKTDKVFHGADRDVAVGYHLL